MMTDPKHIVNQVCDVCEYESEYESVEYGVVVHRVCSEDSLDPTEPLERDPENDVVLD